MQLLVWHKHRLTILKPKFEGLPDGHRSKPDYLFGLAQLFYLVGDRAGSKLLLNHALKPRRERGDVLKVAQTLVGLSGTNELLGLRKEGIRQAKAALEILERLGHGVGQAGCLLGCC